MQWELVLNIAGHAIRDISRSTRDERSYYFRPISKVSRHFHACIPSIRTLELVKARTISNSRCYPEIARQMGREFKRHRRCPVGEQGFEESGSSDEESERKKGENDGSG